MNIGAVYQSDRGCQFTVWAPLRQAVTLEIVAPQARQVPLTQDEQGYWHATVPDLEPGSLYYYVLDGELQRPDPASQSQPQDVHGPSQVVDHAFAWTDDTWQNIPLADLIVYELHVGTFTPEGTFAAIIPRLADLKALGITAIELMPVAQFPGDRNWGYDGVYPFAVQQSYGGPAGLKALVNACHAQGIAVVLDVVYNHFGPEGNYTRDFGPYFTDKYQTPWGSALNFDDAYCEGVRTLFVQNALYWFETYHIDALRLDAVHAIYDFGAKPFLAELAEAVESFCQTQGRTHLLIAESDLNDARVIQPPAQGGYGIDAQWSDDFHHALHALLTGEGQGYYSDFGQTTHLAKALKAGFVYDWQYSPFRKRYHGNYAGDRPGEQFVVCAQNHDQVGNRMLGERLTALASFEALKLSAGAVLLSPYIPLLFMGEEYGEPAPFLYFISHTDPNLVEAVRQGRKAEFADFHAQGEPPDAQSQETFQQSKLNWEKRTVGHHQTLLHLYQHLIQLRQQHPVLKLLDLQKIEVTSGAQHSLSWRRWHDQQQLFCALNFGQETAESGPLPEGTWQKLLDSADTNWMGPGSQTPDAVSTPTSLSLPPQSFVLYASQL